MSDIEFKIIEQANEIADGDYLLTIHNGEIKKVAKADAKVGGGASKIWFTLSSNYNLYNGITENFSDSNLVYAEDIKENWNNGSLMGIYYPYFNNYSDIFGYKPYNSSGDIQISMLNLSDDVIFSVTGMTIYSRNN